MIMAEKKAKAAAKAPEEKANIFTTGKRKKAIARASLKPGKGVVKVNAVPLGLFKNEMYRTRMMEPLLISNAWKGYDIDVNVKGGGQTGQADAVRQAIARALVQADSALKPSFVQYDKHLLAYDSRRNEMSKPSRSSKGPRRHKQRSKR